MWQAKEKPHEEAAICNNDESGVQLITTRIYNALNLAHVVHIVNGVMRLIQNKVSVPAQHTFE